MLSYHTRGLLQELSPCYSVDSTLTGRHTCDNTDREQVTEDGDVHAKTVNSHEDNARLIIHCSTARIVFKPCNTLISVHAR
jgi:hypothetical protein